MIWRLKNIFVTAILVLGSVSFGFAQKIKAFTEEPNRFISELGSFMNEGAKNEAGQITDDFISLWNSKKLSGSQKESIIRTSNLMLERRMKANLEFKEYLRAITSFTKTSQAEDSFDAWQAAIESLLQKKNRFFASFIGCSNDLFESSSIYFSPTTRWKVNSSDYKFEFDSIPRIVFDNAFDLACYTKNDSSLIYQTKGYYLPNKNKWVGNGGKVNWQVAGISSDTVWADLRSYKIDLTGSDYIADTVQFYHTQYFGKPIIGRLENKVMANYNPATALYPKFDSYYADLELKDIIPGTNYKGGFGMHGRKFYGQGKKGIPAIVTVKKGNITLFKAKSLTGFAMNPDKIQSENSEVSIYLAGDSIYHPGISFKVNKRRNEVSVFRNDEGVSNSPFHDSYHQLNMYFDQMLWKLGDTVVDIKMISGQGFNKAGFESKNYFKDRQWMYIQGTMEQSPIYMVKNFYEKKGKNRKIYIDELAKFTGFSVSDMKGLLLTLNEMGLLLYSIEDQSVTLEDRFFFFCDAKVSKTDYDVIRFESSTGSRLLANARLNLDNNNIKVEGIEEIALSDSQNVVLYPQGKSIVLKKNRDFDFSGRVLAGRFLFFGNKFNFEYDKFRIGMEKLDSIAIAVPVDSIEDRLTGEAKVIKLKSVIEKATGYLLIDKPTNKSGRENFGQFPEFHSEKDSYVYYDKEAILDAAYPKDKFFFKVNPFVVDSLDNFKAKDLAFKGDLNSADIFPIFTDTLKVQPDLSLGFVRNTSPIGKPCYKGKGNFMSTIDLSNLGLRGHGELRYLGSKSYAKNFYFYIDSAGALVDSFRILKQPVGGVAFPPVFAKNVQFHWEPYQDVLNTYQTEGNPPFDMYAGQATLSGDLALRPKGLTGNGELVYDASKLVAQNMEFGASSFGAKTGDFSLNTNGDVAFSSKNVSSQFDLEKNEATFTSNDKNSYVTFPADQYIAYVDQYVWKKAAQEIVMGKPGSRNKFVSIHPAQDSLRFEGEGGTYSMKDYKIATKNVKDIYVADAIIYPDSGKVVIEKEAHMLTLKLAKIVADSSHKYHKFYNATVDILGRKNYTGSAYLDFIEGANKQTLFFKQLGVNPSVKTYGMAEVGSGDAFAIHPKISYKGVVNLLASQRELDFDGFGRLKLACNQLPITWFKFNSKIRPDSVYLDVSAMKDDEGNSLYAGLAYDGDSTGQVTLKTYFLSAKTFSKPQNQVLEVKGLLHIDERTKQIMISGIDRLKNDSASFDNYLALDEGKCLIKGEGTYTFSNTLGQVSNQTWASSVSNLATGDVNGEMSTHFNFYFSPEALNEAANEMSNMETLEPVKMEKTLFTKLSNSFIESEKAGEFVSSMETGASDFKLPEVFQYSLGLTNIKWKWDNYNQSLLGTGKVGVVCLNKRTVNKTADGAIEFKKRGARGDQLNIYFESDEFAWYYFRYEDKEMEAIAANETFNETISAVKADKLKLKVEKGEESYQFGPSTEKRMKEFIRRINFKGRGR